MLFDGSPARLAHSSKPTAAGLLLWIHAGTDGRTDGQRDGRTDAVLLHRPCSAYYAGSASNASIRGR